MEKPVKKLDKVLWIALVVSGILVVCCGLFLKYGICRQLGIFQDQNPITLTFLMLDRERVAQEIEKNKPEEPSVEPELPTQAPETEPAPSTEPPATELPTTEPPATTEPETEPTLPPPRFPVPVFGEDESYFDDVLFIGDSRTCGMRDYQRLGKAEYFCKVGMSVETVMYDRASDYHFEEKKLWELLEKRDYGKIYISLGINGAASEKEAFDENYQALIDRIRTYEPDAVLILGSIMTVGRDKAETKWYFNLENLERLNLQIAALAANNENVYYQDVNELFADEEGYLPKEISGDGCHLYGRYYKDWAIWICQQVENIR